MFDSEVFPSLLLLLTWWPSEPAPLSSAPAELPDGRCLCGPSTGTSYQTWGEKIKSYCLDPFITSWPRTWLPQLAQLYRICLQCRRCRKRRFNPWLGKILWKRAWQPTPVFLPGESHGQRNLAIYSPWSCKESDRTEATKHVCTTKDMTGVPHLAAGERKP